MALVKKTKLDKTEIVGEFKCVQCRHVTWVEEDGVLVGGKTYHRYIILPNDDVSNESAEIQAIVATVHTPKVKKAFATFLAKQTGEELA